MDFWCSFRPDSYHGKSQQLGVLVLSRSRAAKSLVEVNGIEPMTSCLQSRRSPN